MSQKPPDMKNAFHGNGHLLAWVAALFLILPSPLILPLVLPEPMRYLGMSKRIGPSDWHAAQVFDDTAPIDILVMGNSRMTTALDHDVLMQVAAERGRPIRSLTLGANHHGYDLAYQTLKDLLPRRKVGLVVVNYPDWPQKDSNPGMKYINRPDATDADLARAHPGIFLRDWGEMALVAPRLAINAIITPGPVNISLYPTAQNLPSDLFESHGSWLFRRGFKQKGAPEHKPFVDRYADDGTGGTVAVLKSGAPVPPDVRLLDQPLSAMDAFYLAAIDALCRSHGTRLAMMGLPLANAEPGTVAVSRQAMETGIPILAASIEGMFGTVPRDHFQDSYYNNSHFNAAGADRAATVFADSLLSLLPPVAQ